MTPASRSDAREACPDAELFVRLAAGALTPAQTEAVDRHVDGCSGCFELLAALADRGDRVAPEHDEPRLLRAGDRAGRYIVTELVGRGGMGLVYAAYDPVLRRAVALKLVRPPERAQASASRRAQLLREAQALARLSHPNVVPIHDVGTAGEQLWVVMELVDGITLRAWTLAHPQASWREKLAVLASCGRALAAAHAAGIVHRDFKPDNVMIGADRRVRVMDFGLAHVGGNAHADQTAGSGGSDTTATRGVIGTPAYMAPEQHGGAVIDARADQFAFAVTAFELLWSVRPFPGDDAEAIARAIASGRIRELPRADVPRRLYRVLARALAADPSDRHPDMSSLLDALARDPTRARRGVLAIAALVTIAAGGLGLRTLAEHRDARACRAQAEASLADPATAELGAVLGGTEIAERVELRVRTWSSTWVAADGASCIAQHGDPRGEQAEQRACLREGAAALHSAVTVIVQGDAPLRTRALEIVDELPDPARCADPARRFGRSRDAETLAAVTELRERLARGRVLQSAGRDRDALALVSAALVDARALGDDAALAQVLEAVGGLQERVGQLAQAERDLAESYFVAGRSGTDRIAATAASGLAQLVAAHLARPADAHGWARHAEMMLARVPEPEPADLAALRNATATIAWYEGDYEGALAGYREAEQLLADALGPDDPQLAALAANLGVASYELGRHDEALAHLDRALALHTAAWGPAHPDVARDQLLRANALILAGRTAEAERAAQLADRLAAAAIGPDHPDRIAYFIALGTVAAELGHTDEALRWHGAALALARRSFGEDHPDVGIALVNLGNVLDGAGRHEQAITHFEQALAIFGRVYGEQHEKLGAALHDLALAEHGAGRDAEAIAHYREAFAIWERAFGPSSLVVGRGRMNLGNALLAHGDHDAAIVELRRAAEIIAAAAGAEAPVTAVALSRLGLALHRLGRDSEAIAPLERALALRERGPDRERVAELEFALAEALWRVRHDRERATRLARAALASYRELDIAEQVTALERFVATLG